MIHKHLIITIVVVLLMCGIASALSGYSYSDDITIINNGDNKTYYEYTFTWDTASLIADGKMELNGSDVRITNVTDVLLDWWNETSFNTSNTRIWVNATFLTNVTTTTHHAWYGNATSSYVGDSNNTFKFFDGFNRADSATVGNNWVESLNVGDIWINDSCMHAVGSAGVAGVYQPFTFTDKQLCVGARVNYSAHVKPFYVLQLHDGAYQTYLKFCSVDSLPNGDSIDTGDPANTLLDPFVVGQWYVLETGRIDSSNFSMFLDHGAQTLLSYDPVTASTDNRIQIYPSYYAGAESFTDWVYVRSFDEKEPVATITSSEGLSGASPGTSDIKYVSNRSVTYSATAATTSNCSWSWSNGTIFEWDNSTTTPSTEIWINTSSVKYINTTLKAYNISDIMYDSITWNNSITDDVYDSNYTFSRIAFHDIYSLFYEPPLIYGDVDNDGANEFFAIGGDTYGYVGNDNGTIIQEIDGTYRVIERTKPYLYSSVSLHDVDKDGLNEIVVGLDISAPTPRARVDLWQFNGTHTNQSSLNNAIDGVSDYPHGNAWFNISNRELNYYAFCGGGEVSWVETNFTSTDNAVIDTVANSGEDSLAYDIDHDGTDELIVCGGYSAGAAVIYCYEINNVTGAYTSKTTLLTTDLDSNTHYVANVDKGDVDNDGVEELIVMWTRGSPVFSSSNATIEIYQFNSTKQVVNAFMIDSGFSGLYDSDTKSFTADIDKDGLNEFVHGNFISGTGDISKFTLRSYDIGINGSTIEKTVIANYSTYYPQVAHWTLAPVFMEDTGQIGVVVSMRNTATDEQYADFLILESPSVNDIVLGPNKYGMLCKDVTAAQTFNTIASGFTHDVCFTWWNNVTDIWMSYWVGDSYNSGQSVPKHESYFVLMDGTGETVSCAVAAAETVAIPIGWSSTYLRESTSKTLTAIKADMGGNCADLYAWNHTAAGTGAWTNNGAYSVLPNQGLLVDASAGFSWDGTVP